MSAKYSVSMPIETIPLSKRILENPQPFKSLPSKKMINRLPNGGSYYTETELKEIYPVLHIKQLNEISKYSDYIVRGSYKEEWYINLVKSYIQNATDVNILRQNTTGIGNLAFLMLNSADEDLVNMCKHFYHVWQYSFIK